MLHMMGKNRKYDGIKIDKILEKDPVTALLIEEFIILHASFCYPLKRFFMLFSLFNCMGC
jgi:hypothetical protein